MIVHIPRGIGMYANKDAANFSRRAIFDNQNSRYYLKDVHEPCIGFGRTYQPAPQ